MPHNEPSLYGSSPAITKLGHSISINNHCPLHLTNMTESVEMHIEVDTVGLRRMHCLMRKTAPIQSMFDDRAKSRVLTDHPLPRSECAAVTPPARESPLLPRTPHGGLQHLGRAAKPRSRGRPPPRWGQLLRPMKNDNKTPNGKSARQNKIRVRISHWKVMFV